MAREGAAGPSSERRGRWPRRRTPGKGAGGSYPSRARGVNAILRTRNSRLGGLRTTLPGIAFGVALAVAMGRVAQGILPFSALDPPTYASVALILLMVIVGVCLAPAWRAASVPVAALRFE